MILKHYATEECEQKVDLVISLIDLLMKFNGFDIDLCDFIKTESKKYPDNILRLTSSSSKKFILQLIKKYIDLFIKEDFLIKLLKLYFLDQNPGIYEAASNLLLHIYSNKEHHQYLSSNKFIENIIEYLNSIILTNDSIFLIRKFELILKYVIAVYPNHSEISTKELESMTSAFYSYDILTQLAFLETIDSNIASNDILNILNPSTYLINENIMDLPAQTMRKLLFTFSKFYAANILSELKLIKNTLAISFQYYQDTKMADFICPIILNVFFNQKIYEYLMDSANNIPFNFKENINVIIIENYLNHDPNIKLQVLEVFQRMFLFPKEGNQLQELYIRDFVKLFVNSQFNELEIKNEEDALSKFTNKLYQDFKKHDLPDYEEQFLSCLMSFTSNTKTLKALLSNFDFVLYLLNRREKPQNVLLIKFNLIEGITKSAVFGDMNYEFSNKFSRYVKKGAY